MRTCYTSPPWPKKLERPPHLLGGVKKVRQRLEETRKNENRDGMSYPVLNVFPQPGVLTRPLKYMENWRYTCALKIPKAGTLKKLEH